MARQYRKRTILIYDIRQEKLWRYIQQVKQDGTCLKSQARRDLFKLVDSTTHEPIIVGKHNKAVLLSEEYYRAMVETLHIMSVPGLKESIIEMHNQPLKEYSKEIDL